MTELQMGLIGLGVAAVAGVLGYNKWQELRHRKVAQSVLKPQHDDVLLSGGAPRAPVRHERDATPVTPVERREPVLAEPTLSDNDAAPVDEAPFTVDPVIDDIPEPSVNADLVAPEPAAPAMPLAPVMDEEPPAAIEVPAELLDPRVEFIVAMELVEMVPARQILESQRKTLQRLTKPVHWLGFNERTREWARLASDSEFSVRRLRVGLQLVNRLGPVSESDVSVFTSAMQALADDLMAVADMPPSRVLDQAAEIDRFCAAVDLEIGLNLVSRGSAFPGTKIRALAEAAGMELGVDGLFTRYDDDGHPQFSLQNYESTRFSADGLRTLTTHGLTFLLDVPRVDHGERVFGQMTELARRFGEALQGTLVDDNRQPLGEPQLEHIRREFIGKPQATMARFGLPAGSPQARRLFS